jgi:type I restriction enzyme S subunit
MAPAPKLDISPGDLKIVLDILARHVPDREVWAFGSRATWKTKDFSDLDLAVIGEEPLSLKVSAALSDDFAESDLPFKVDVVDWATTSDNFREIIRRDRVVVQGCWLQTTIGEQATLQRGFDITQAQACPGSIPVISSSGTSFSHNVAMAKGPGVIIGRKGSLGTVFYIEGDYWPHDTTLWVKDFHGNDPSFVYYFFKNLSVMHLDVGSANPTLNRNHVHPIPTVWPPLPEQQRIAALLGALDDKIDLNRRMNETLEAMARALFKSWFVDFDPVRAKMEGRQPVGMDEATSNLFSSAISDETGLPLEWRKGKLTAQFFVLMGQSPPGETYNEVGAGLPFYQGRRDFGFRFPSRRVHCIAATRLADAGDVLVSVRAPVGDLNIAIERCAIGRGVPVVRHPKGYQSYCFHSLMSLREHFNKFEAEGTVFGAINKDQFLALPLAYPPEAIVKAFEDIVCPLDMKVRANHAQMETLAALRDLLLPKLLSGELRIKDAEKAVEAAL